MLQQRNMPAEDDHAWHQSSLPHSARKREALPAELSDEDVESSQMARTNHCLTGLHCLHLPLEKCFGRWQEMLPSKSQHSSCDCIMKMKRNSVNKTKELAKQNRQSPEARNGVVRHGCTLKSHKLCCWKDATCFSAQGLFGSCGSDFCLKNHQKISNSHKVFDGQPTKNHGKCHGFWCFWLLKDRAANTRPPIYSLRFIDQTMPSWVMAPRYLCDFVHGLCVYCRWYDIWCMNHYMYIHMHPYSLLIYCNKYYEYLRAMEMHFRTTWTFFTFQFGQSMRRIVSWHTVRLTVKGICKWRLVTRKWYCNLF